MNKKTTFLVVTLAILCISLACMVQKYRQNHAVLVYWPFKGHSLYVLSKPKNNHIYAFTQKNTNDSYQDHLRNLSLPVYELEPLGDGFTIWRDWRDVTGWSPQGFVFTYSYVVVCTKQSVTFADESVVTNNNGFAFSIDTVTLYPYSIACE